MPIYAYRCTSCGHAQDVLQKISDPLLTICPACGAASFAKQVTAAGFQLKGSGWYVTDFRGGNNAAAKKDDPAGGEKASADKPATEASGSSSDKPADKAAAAAASPSPAPASSAAAAPAPPPAAGT